VNSPDVSPFHNRIGKQKTLLDFSVQSGTLFAFPKVNHAKMVLAIYR